MNIDYHNCTCVLYVLSVLINIVWKIMRLVVNVFCNIFKVYKITKVLTTYFENELCNLRSDLWFRVHGPTEYEYAVGAWTRTSRSLLRYYIKWTLISELRMTIEPIIFPVPNHDRDWNGPLWNRSNNCEIISIWVLILKILE